MQNKFYVDQWGNYLGEFSQIKIIQRTEVLDEETQLVDVVEDISYQDNPAVPTGAIEIQERPSDLTSQKYNLTSAQWECDLAKIKERKVEEIKSIRDQKNIEPITDHQGFLMDEEGITTTQESYFVFYTNRHRTNPASDPDSIISRVLDLGAIPYFTKDISGNKITIQLTADLATSLRQRTTERNNNNYKLSSLIEAEINGAQTAEEVEAIDLEA